MRSAAICFAVLALTADGVLAQAIAPLKDSPVPPPGSQPQAPIGHRQPTIKDLPTDVQKEEQLGAPQTQREQQSQTQPQSPSKAQTARGRAQSRSKPQTARDRGSGGGTPVLQVDPSCEAAGRGAVMLGRNKEACLADETAAQDTLKQNWSKYATSDRTQCIGMVTTGGPASYVELLSCIEIMRDARVIENTDPLESDLGTPGSTRPRRGRRR
jgi:hypothetical protein